MLNKHSGLYGISGVSSDMRDLLSAESAQDRRARLAIDIFCQRIRSTSAPTRRDGRADAVAFTGGIGENSAEVAPRVGPRPRVPRARARPGATSRGGRQGGDRGRARARAGSRHPDQRGALIARDTVRRVRNSPRRGEGSPERRRALELGEPLVGALWRRGRSRRRRGPGAGANGARVAGWAVDGRGARGRRRPPRPWSRSSRARFSSFCEVR